MSLEQTAEQRREERLNNIRARLDSFSVDAQFEIVWLMEQVGYLTQPKKGESCDVCDGQPERFEPCVCGGTGQLKDAARNRLTRMVETEMKLGEALYALRGVDAKWPEAT